MKKRRPLLRFISDAVSGKNKFGRKANKVLPFRKVRETIGAVVNGAKDIVPLTQTKDASVVRDAEKVKKLVEDLPNDYAELNKIFKESPDLVVNKLYQIKDLLDDGRLNGSAEGLSPETKFKLRLSTSLFLLIAVIYQIASIFFDWPSLPFLQFIGS